jgi:hypothetical protein
MFLNRSLEAGIPAMFWVDIQHDQAGNHTGNNPDIAVWPVLIPALYFFHSGWSMLEFQPTKGWAFIASAHRDNRPTPLQVF